MDDDSPPPTQFRSESTTISHGSAYTGAFFPRSQNFTISGGTLTSVTHNHTSLAVPADFRRIPLGDINLRNEIRLHKESGVIGCQRSWGSVRRMYSAEIDGRKSNMTVTLYEGDNSEEEWRDTITRYSRLRHPNFLQIFATASSFGIHAIVAHDDLIPFDDFLQLHRDSPILSVYIHGCWDMDRREAFEYFLHMFGNSLNDKIAIFWICHSTGRLCVDLTPGDVAEPGWSRNEWTLSFHNIPPLNDPNSEDIVIDSLELGEYHGICSKHLAHSRSFLVSTQEEFHLGALVGSELDSLDKIAFLPDAKPHISSWSGGNVVGDTMEDGWTHYNSGEIFGATLRLVIDLEYGDQLAWLSQANHIFHQLQIKSNYEDHAIIVTIDFWLQILEPTQTPPKGYLFICPAGDLQTGPSSFQWPDCPAYWSLNISGVKRLSMDEAMHLGFPSIELKTGVDTKFWDASFYAGLHKFHKRKGFNPDSQDVAQHLAYPLFQLSHEMDMPFAHVDGEVSDVETEGEGILSTTLEDPDNLTPGDKCISLDWVLIG